MVHIFLVITFVFATWKWADWRNWRTYYPTILFFVALNFVYCYMTYKKPLWEFNRNAFPNITLQTLSITFVNFTCSVLLYLSLLPKKRVLRPLYIIGWVAFFSLVEYFSERNGMIRYYNGWSLGWSVLFDLVMFPLLYLHHLQPLLAWALTIIISAFLLWKFGITMDSMK